MFYLGTLPPYTVLGFVSKEEGANSYQITKSNNYTNNLQYTFTWPTQTRQVVRVFLVVGRG